MSHGMTRFKKKEEKKKTHLEIILGHLLCLYATLSHSQQVQIVTQRQMLNELYCICRSDGEK